MVRSPVPFALLGTEVAGVDAVGAVVALCAVEDRVGEMPFTGADEDIGREPSVFERLTFPPPTAPYPATPGASGSSSGGGARIVWSMESFREEDRVK